MCWYVTYLQAFNKSTIGYGGSDTIPNLVQGCQDSGIINQNFDYYSRNFCISLYIVNYVIRLPNLVNRNQVINQPNLVQKSGSVGRTPRVIIIVSHPGILILAMRAGRHYH